MSIQVCVLPGLPGDELRKKVEKKVRKAVMNNSNFIKYYAKSMILWIKQIIQINPEFPREEGPGDCSAWPSAGCAFCLLRWVALLPLVGWQQGSQ